MQKTNAVSVTVHTLGGDPVHPLVIEALERYAESLASDYKLVVNVAKGES